MAFMNYSISVTNGYSDFFSLALLCRFEFLEQSTDDLRMFSSDVVKFSDILVQIVKQRWVVTGYRRPLSGMRIGWLPGCAVDFKLTRAIDIWTVKPCSSWAGFSLSRAGVRSVDIQPGLFLGSSCSPVRVAKVA